MMKSLFNKIVSTFIFLSIIFNNISFAQNDFQPSLSKANQIVTEILECYVQNEEVVGLAFAVSYKDSIIYSQGFGSADLEKDIPVTPNTGFRYASVSKLFLATAIAKLSETGRLDLDEPVSTYVPYFPAKKWPVTSRQIAAHIAGIRGYEAKDFIAGHDIHQQKFATTKEALAIFSEDSLLFQPGTQYKYSIFGFTLLTAIVENITGKLYEDYLREEVLLPLGIKSVVPDRPEKVIVNRSRLYEPTRERQIEHAPPIRSDFKFGGGGLLGTAEDLVRLGKAMIRPGFFKATTLEKEIFIEQLKTDGAPVHVGLAWRIGIDKEFGKVYHHSGSLPGGRSVLIVWPEYELVIAATSNTTNAPYYAEEFGLTLSHLFLTTVKGSELSPYPNYFKGENLIFTDTNFDTSKLLTLSQTSCSGSIETPPSIERELVKRGFPKQERVVITKTYQNFDGTYSAIIASDIGLHRLQFAGNRNIGLSGHLVELANKFEWRILNHEFFATKKK